MSRCSCGTRWSGGLGGEHSAGPANRLVWSTVARTTNACPGVVSCLGHSCRAEQCAACPHKPCRQPVEEGSNAWDFWWGGNGQKFDFKLLQGGQCSIASGRRCTGGPVGLALLRLRALRCAARVLMMQCCPATATLKQSSRGAAVAAAQLSARLLQALRCYKPLQQKGRQEGRQRFVCCRARVDEVQHLAYSSISRGTDPLCNIWIPLPPLAPRSSALALLNQLALKIRFIIWHIGAPLPLCYAGPGSQRVVNRLEAHHEVCTKSGLATNLAALLRQVTPLWSWAWKVMNDHGGEGEGEAEGEGDGTDGNAKILLIACHLVGGPLRPCGALWIANRPTYGWLLTDQPAPTSRSSSCFAQMHVCVPPANLTLHRLTPPPPPLLCARAPAPGSQKPTSLQPREQATCLHSARRTSATLKVGTGFLSETARCLDNPHCC